MGQMSYLNWPQKMIGFGTSGRKMVVDTVSSDEKGSAGPHETVVPAR